MKYKVKSRFQRISPRKMRAQVSFIKGKKVQDLEMILASRTEKGVYLILKILKSALDSAKIKEADMDSLKVADIIVNQGPRLKRRRIKTRGRADIIQKRYSHITLILEDKKRKRKRTKKHKKEVDQRRKI